MTWLLWPAVVTKIPCGGDIACVADLKMWYSATEDTTSVELAVSSSSETLWVSTGTLTEAGETNVESEFTALAIAGLDPTYGCASIGDECPETTTVKYLVYTDGLGGVVEHRYQSGSGPPPLDPMVGFPVSCSV